jgi:hypothetical protein
MLSSDAILTYGECPPSLRENNRMIPVVKGKTDCKANTIADFKE